MTVPLHQELLDQDERIYPESDGAPMGETPFHRDEIIYVIDALKYYFRNAPDVYVSGNMFLYYEQGNLRASVVPDVFVVKGIPKLPERRVYKLWVERQPPAVVIEMTSESTSKQDQDDKYQRYAALGVREYFLFDPLEEYLQPALQGYRLRGWRYFPIQPQPDGSLLSRQLGLYLQRDGSALRLIEAASGQPLRRYAEEATERRALEDEVARLKAELERLKQDET